MGLVKNNNELDRGTPGAAATTKRILSEIANLGNQFMDCDTPDQTTRWLTDVNEMFSFCTGIEDGSLKGQAALLINMQALWPDLPLKFRESWKNDFWFFAETKTGKDQDTLKNHMRAVRVFLINKKAPSGPVAVPKRDVTGAPILNKAKEPEMEHVVWDPVTVPTAKLVAIAARAQADQMTPKLWTVAADPGGTWKQMQIALSEANSGGGGGSGDGFDMSFYLAGPYLFVREGAFEAFVADLSLPYDDDIVLTSPDNLRERALRKLFTLLGVKEESKTAQEALERVGLTIYPKDIDNKTEP